MGFLCSLWRRRRAYLVCIEISHCLQFRDVSDFALSPISHCLQFRTVFSFTLCFQFCTVSNFVLSRILHCLQFHTVSDFALSPISCSVSNFALRLQVFTLSPASHFVSNFLLCLQIFTSTSHPATSHVTSQHHISLRPSHLKLLHPFWPLLSSRFSVFFILFISVHWCHNFM